MDQAVGMGCNVRLTGVMDRFNWRLQYERDAPLDRSGIKQTYADVLVTARFQAVKIPSGGAALLPTKISPPMRRLMALLQ